MYVSRQECLLYLFELLFEESLERIPSVPILVRQRSPVN